jgi:hypothetical protein
MIGLAVSLLLVLVAGASIAAHVAAFHQIAALRGHVDALERERAADRELLEAILLEEPGKVRRLMGRAGGPAGPHPAA